MKPELSCPVCAYTEISGNSCPNCDTDLSLICLLTELPPSSPQVTEFDKPRRLKVAGWQVGAALLILMMGIGMGAVGSFLFLQPSQLLTNTVTSPSSVAIRGNEKVSQAFGEGKATPRQLAGEINSPGSSPIAQEPINRQQPTQYTVKLGDHLTAITEQFCGKGKSWQVMVQANPQLKAHPDFLKVGEVLKVPNCEG